MQRNMNTMAATLSSMMARLPSRGTWDLAIDLGARRLRIWSRDSGIVVDEPAVVAVRNGLTGALYAVGTEAQELAGRVGPDITVVWPQLAGQFKAPELLARLLKYYLSRARPSRWKKIRAIVGVPAGADCGQMRTRRNVIREAGVPEIMLIDECLAAAMGAEALYTSRSGAMVVDIGLHVTRTAIHANGRIIKHSSHPIGAIGADEALIRYFQQQHGLTIGHSAAESIKLEACALLRDGDEGDLDIRGVALFDKVPHHVRVGARQLAFAIYHAREQIVNAIESALAGTPPELGGDLSENGILLVGGGALLPGIAGSLKARTGLPVQIANTPLTCVVRGAGAAISSACMHAPRILPASYPDRPSDRRTIQQGRAEWNSPPPVLLALKVRSGRRVRQVPIPMTHT